LLLATADAWATPLAGQRRRPDPSANDDDAALDAALGIRAVRRSK
jgi:hypothetical protein